MPQEVPISDKRFDWRYPNDNLRLEDVQGEGQDSIPTAIEHLESGREKGDHPGWQLYVQQGFNQVASLSAGWARSGHRMTNNTLLPIFCCIKPIVAVTALKTFEQYNISINDPVVKILHEFAEPDNKKSSITFRHILTHSMGFAPDPIYKVYTELFQKPDELWEVICKSDLPIDINPGYLAYYSTYSGWFILARALEHLTGNHYWESVQKEILIPLWLKDIIANSSIDELDMLTPRIGLLFDVKGHPRVYPTLSEASYFRNYMPGVKGLSTAKDLGIFYGSLSESTSKKQPMKKLELSALTSRHRVGMYDSHFESFISWGLGVLVDGWFFGRSCSPNSFGHTGLFSSMVVVDPVASIVIACLTNGITSGHVSRARIQGVVDSVYRDLGISVMDKQAPQIISVEPDKFSKKRESAREESYYFLRKDKKNDNLFLGP